MHRHVLVTFLETTVFAYVMQVITTNDNCTLHLQFLNDTGQDAATDAYIASEWAFVVDVSAIDCLLRDGRSEKKVKNDSLQQIRWQSPVVGTQLHTSFGVLKPNPTSRWWRRRIFRCPDTFFRRTTGIVNCFWKARSVCVERRTNLIIENSIEWGTSLYLWLSEVMFSICSHWAQAAA